MGVSRNCGHFIASLNISGGLHSIRGTIAKLDKRLQENASKVMIELKRKHEEALLEEWCEAFGWPKNVADVAAATAQRDREDLLEADRKGREDFRRRRLAAGR